MSPKQIAAIRVLERGESYAEVARQVGVRRETVSSWANHHVGFQAELTQRQGRTPATVRSRLEVAAIDAVAVLHDIVLNDPNNRTKVVAAKAILQRVSDLAEKVESTSLRFGGWSPEVADPPIPVPPELDAAERETIRSLLHNLQLEVQARAAKKKNAADRGDDNDPGEKKPGEGLQGSAGHPNREIA